jgi:hypothetical protein
VAGHWETCFASGDIPVGVIAAVGGAYYASGNALLTPKPNQGIGYSIQLTQPLYFLAAADILGFTFAVPLWITPQLFGGTLSNIVRQEGEVDIIQNQQGRKYSIDINFDHASFLDSGLEADGSLKVNWK